MKRLAILAAVAACAPAMASAQTKTSVVPYIEVDQTVLADLSNGNDAVTYTSVAAGVDASVQGQRVEGQASLRYEHRFTYQKRTSDEDLISGLVRGAVKVAPGLSVDAGALATRISADVNGTTPLLTENRVGAVSDIYSLYVGPTLSTGAGPVKLGASYRFGYTKVTEPTFGVFGGNGAALRDYYDDSTSHIAQGIAVVKPGDLLPIGLTGTAGWEREDEGSLQQRFDDWFVRGDVLLPVSPTFALTAGVGYEKLQVSDRDPLLTGTGAPVVDDRGRLVPDLSAPRRIAYRTDGIYYDAGVVWHPGPRTSVEAHVGRRYDSLSYTGLATYQGRRVSVRADVYDTVETFGHQLRTALTNLPTSFVSQRDILSQQYSGCVFGAGGAPGACLNQAFQAISTAAYRANGVDAILSASSGRTTFGFGAGYQHRRFLSGDQNSGFRTTGLTDDSFYGDIFANRQLTVNSSIGATFLANYYDQQFGPGITSYGGTLSYARTFGRRLNGNLGLGVFDFSVPRAEDQVTLTGQAGLRYSF